MDSAPLPTAAEPVSPPEGWFDSLPEEHRRRILDEDAARLDDWIRLERQQARAWWKPCLQAAALLALVSFYVCGFAWSAFVTGFVSGGVAGWAWHLSAADRLQSMFIAVAAFFAGLIVTGQLTFFAVIWAPLPICVVSVFCGLRREELPGA